MPTNVPSEHALVLDRARLLRRAAAGAAAVGVVGMAGAADALAHDRDDDDRDHHRRESPGRIVDALATAESFGVTFDKKIRVYLSDEDEIANGVAYEVGGLMPRRTAEALAE